jgi:carboxyl-terminal processing protease
MYMSKIKSALAFALVCGGVAVGPGLMLRQSLIAQAPQSLEIDPPATPVSAGALHQNEKQPQKKDTGRKSAPYDPTTLARRVWAILGAVEKNAIESKPRAIVLSEGAKHLLETAHVKVPGVLSERIAAVATEQDLISFLREIWPGPGAAAPDETLEAAFLAGVLGSIPGKPAFLPAVLARVTEQSQANRYVGIGLQVKVNAKEKYPEIVTPTRHGPLREGGARARDLITEVDGKSTRGVELSKVVDWLRGEEGSSVTLVLQRPGEAALRTLRLTRSVVPFDHVFGYRRAGEGWTYRIDPAMPVAYVRLDSITSSALHELRQIEPQLQAEGVRALVLDLRFAGWPEGGHSGDLHAAALAANAFLDGGLLWRVRDQHQQLKEYRADRECLFRRWPMAVLVNKETYDIAHAALAAALQDNGRAVLVGAPTGADDYVTSLVALPDQLGAISVRTARMERAAKDRGWPVQPDHRVALTKAQVTAVAGWLRFKDFPEPPAGVDEKPPEDPQLARAVQLLREQMNVAERGAQGER